MQFLVLLFLSIPLDAIEIILTLIDVGTIIGLIIHLFQIILDLIFNLLLIIFGLLSTFRQEMTLTRLILRRVLPILISAVGETIPVIDALPLRTITLIFLWLETSGILDRIIERIRTTVSTVLSVIPSPLRKRIELLGKKVEALAEKSPVLSTALKLTKTKELREKIGLVSEDTAEEAYSPPKKPVAFQPIIVKPSNKKEKKEPYIIRKAAVTFFILFILFPLFASAQTIDVYLFSKKTVDGTIVSAIFVDKKTKLVYSFPTPSLFEWKIPISQIPEIISYKPFIKINLDKNYSGGIFKIKLSVKDLVREKNLFSFENNIYLEEPDVSIVYLKKNYFESPFIENFLEKDPITFKTYGFSSNNLIPIWKLNGIFISNEKFLMPHLLSKGFLSLEIRNPNNRAEVVFESAFLK